MNNLPLVPPINNENKVCYFNNAAQAPLSKNVQNVGIQQINASPWDDPKMNHDYIINCQQEVRQLFAYLIHDQDEQENIHNNNNNNNCDSFTSNVAIMPSTAFAMTLAARNIQRLLHIKLQQEQQEQKEEDVVIEYCIIVIQDQYDSAIYPWQQICEEEEEQEESSNGSGPCRHRYKVRLDIIPYPTTTTTTNVIDDSKDKQRPNSSSTTSSFSPAAASSWTGAILDRIQQLQQQANTEILTVCLPPIHWSDGSIINLELISEICQHGHIPFVVDATQAVGIMSINIRTIRPTLLACSTHKWLRGPSGMSLVYISPTVHNTWIPLDYHGRGRDYEAGNNNSNISKNGMSPTGYPTRYYNDGRKFDSGGKPNPILLPMIQTSMKEVIQLYGNNNFHSAQEYIQSLMLPLRTWIQSNDCQHYTIITEQPHVQHIISIIPTNKTPTEMIIMTQQLQSIGIYVSVRCGGIRISPYLNNTKEDVNKLIIGLKQVV